MAKDYSCREKRYTRLSNQGYYWLSAVICAAAFFVMLIGALSATHGYWLPMLIPLNMLAPLGLFVWCHLHLLQTDDKHLCRTCDQVCPRAGVG